MWKLSSQYARWIIFCTQFLAINDDGYFNLYRFKNGVLKFVSCDQICVAEPLKLSLFACFLRFLISSRPWPVEQSWSPVLSMVSWWLQICHYHRDWICGLVDFGWRRCCLIWKVYSQRWILSCWLGDLSGAVRNFTKFCSMAICSLLFPKTPCTLFRLPIITPVCLLETVLAYSPELVQIVNIKKTYRQFAPKLKKEGRKESTDQQVAEDNVTYALLFFLFAACQNYWPRLLWGSQEAIPLLDARAIRAWHMLRA